MEEFLEVLGDLVMIGCGAALLYAFLSIFFLGGYMACEPSNTILYSEIGMSAVIVIFGINRFLGDCRKRKG